MADLSGWLNKVKQYGQRVANDYMSAGQQASGIGNELAGKARSMDQARVALGQQPVTQEMQQQYAPPVAPADSLELSPYDKVNPGYRPIGGANALRQLYQGNPPNLRRQSGSTTTTKQDSGPGF